MKTVINKLNIGYDIAGEGTPVLLLHGWGVDRSSLKPVFDNLKGICRVCSVDLPGFGESDEPETPYTADDYADFIESFIEFTGFVKPVIFGHSNGGRCSIALTGRGYDNISKLVLTGSTGIKPKRKLSYYIRTYSFKLGKKALKWPLIGKLLSKKFDPSKYGSADYKAASPLMKRTMSLLINQDLTDRLKNIKVPALLFWGENDTAAPLSDGKKMEKLIPDAALIIYKGGNHYAFLHNFNEFIAAFSHFITH